MRVATESVHEAGSGVGGVSTFPPEEVPHG